MKTSFALDLSLFLAVLVGLASFAYYKLDKAETAEVLARNTRRAQAYVPPNASVPVKLEEASQILSKLNIPKEEVPALVLFSEEGQPGIGCALATSEGAGSGSGNTPSDACKKAFDAYKEYQVATIAYENSPRFDKSPYSRSYLTAREAAPYNSREGDAKVILPLLESAKFSEGLRVAIYSYAGGWGTETPSIKPGCVVASTLGIFKASADTEVKACQSVIALLQSEVNRKNS